MHPTTKTARIAGAFYLALALTGIFYIVYVPSQIIDWGDPGATIENLRANESLFRMGIVSSLISTTIYILLVCTLYMLFESTQKYIAALMVIFVVASVPIAFIIASYQMSILTLLSSSAWTQGVDTAEVEAQILLLLDSYKQGMGVSTIFWGLWLFPFGILALRSGYLPRLLGFALLLGCVGYLINFAGPILFPDYASVVPARLVRLPASVGELGSMFWLLLFGVRKAALVTPIES